MLVNGEKMCDDDLHDLTEKIIKTCFPIGQLFCVGNSAQNLANFLKKRGADVSFSQNFLEYSSLKQNNKNSSYEHLHANFFSLPFSNNFFETIVLLNSLESIPALDLQNVINEIYRISKNNILLKINCNNAQEISTSETRAFWEKKFFEAGFRKHFYYYWINDYESLNFEQSEIFILLSKINNETVKKYPLFRLQEERDLHMDMLRETGARSDAHIYRYYSISKYIRPGDVVLDAACGLGYGTHLLKSISYGKKFTGIDSSEYAITYAKENFQNNEKIINFSLGYLPEYINSFKENTVDVIVSFETLEHVISPDILLNEFYRVLTPGGRLILSIPNDWSDETGEDPNPYHFHVYDLKKIKTQISSLFDIEHIFIQTANQVKLLGKKCKWESRLRSYQEIDTLNITEIESEWIIVVATKSPIGLQNTPYKDNIFSEKEISVAGNSLAFARDYTNPWLVKSMISIGLRSENLNLRKKWAEVILDTFEINTADYGSALCILLYIEIEVNLNKTENFELINKANIYLNIKNDKNNPAINRWIISIKYALGLYYLSIGDKKLAINFFTYISADECFKFHPTLLVKYAQAYYQIAFIYFLENNFEESKKILVNSIYTLNFYLGEYYKTISSIEKPKFEANELNLLTSILTKINLFLHSIENNTIGKSYFYDEVNLSLSSKDFLQKQEIKNLNNALILQKKSISDLLEGKNWLENEWNNLKNNAQEKDKQIEIILEGKNWLENEWNNLKNNVQEKDKQIEIILEGKNWLENEWNNLKNNVQEKDKQIEIILEGKNNLEKDVINLKNDIREKNKEIEKMKYSISWKITAPIRFICSLLK